MIKHDQKAVWFWQDRIVLRKGQYVYIDQNNVCHAISHEEARNKERSFEFNQAQMACQRGGLEIEHAMGARGFVKNAYGGWDYNAYKVDNLTEE